MRPVIVAVMLGVVLAMFASTPAYAADCEFRLGFKTLRDLIGHDIVGECLENERYNAIGDSNQRTTGGLMAWRKADNWTAFTDGYRTWINGPDGLVQRLNTERFEWEADYAPGGIATPTPIPRVIESELAYALEVMTLLPIGKTARAWFDEASPSLTYGTPPSEEWTSFYHEPPRNEIVVSDVLRNERSEVQAAVIVWQTVIAINTKRYGLKRERWVSGGDCLAEVVTAERMMAQWWVERFGANGLGNASTSWELWLNDRAQHYQNDTLESAVRSQPGYRDWCAPYGSLPPIPAPVIDPTLAHAYHIMRRSPTGNQVADTFVRLGAGVQFGTGGDSLTSWSEFPPGIRLHERYRHESYEVQAFMLIFPTVLMASVSDFGQPQSWEQCISRRADAYTQAAKYWLETYGASGKQNPTEEEKFANAVLAAHLANGIRHTLAMDSICEYYGTPATPTPTPTPRPTIDPTLANALDVMRSTRTGREIAGKFVQLGTSAVFGPLDGSTSRVSYSPRRITINQEYRSESPEALAHALIWPTLAMSVWVEEGSSTTWNECMNRMIAIERLQAQWWLEKFGANGKRNATQMEQWANNDLGWLRTQNSRNVWMSTHYREQCKRRDDPGPHVDPDLADAFVTALKRESEIGRAAVDAVVAAGTEVVFGRVAGWGSYSPLRNVITINEGLKGYSEQVLASVLIHEAYHVASHGSRGGRPQGTAAECLQEEVDAFRLSASWWYEWYGRFGKSGPNRVELTNNALMRAWLNGDLREWVLLSEAYQHQCLGGTVE